MKKILVFLSLLSLLFTFGVMAQGITMTMPSVPAPLTGASVGVPINVTNFNDIGAITLKITYNPAVMTYTSVSGAPAGITFQVNGTTPGVIRLGWFDGTGSTPMSIGSDTLLVLNFTYNSGTGSFAFATATPGDCEIANGIGTVITGVSYQGGSLYTATNTKITIPNVHSPAAGSTVNIPINVKNFDGVGAITLRITYNPAVVSYVSVLNAPAGITFTVGTNTLGIINLGWYDATLVTPLTIDSGKLVDIRFTYLAGEGQFNFTTDSCEVSNGLGIVIPGIIYGGGLLGPTVSVETQNKDLPTEYALLQNYPNPFNPTTNITFGVPQNSNVKIMIYDILGHEVTTLVNANYAQGYHMVPFNASKLASGTYIYRMTSQALHGDQKMFTNTQKFMLLK
jgi:hypothetical protein